MDLNRQKSVLDPLICDGFDFDCPQKLENLDQVKVDDSWFLQKANFGDTRLSQKEEDKRKEQIERLSTISEKENYPSGSNPNSNETYSRPRCSSYPSETSTQQNALPSEPPASTVNSDASSSSASDVPAGAEAAAAAPPKLVTANRCQQRSKWETLRLQRERRFDQLRQQRKDSICRHEQERVQHLRAAAVPKAHPIRHYKPMRIHRSERPLTVAKSPDFVLSRRDRHKPIQDQPE